MGARKALGGSSFGIGNIGNETAGYVASSFFHPALTSRIVLIFAFLFILFFFAFFHGSRQLLSSHQYSPFQDLPT